MQVTQRLQPPRCSWHLVLGLRASLIELHVVVIPPGAALPRRLIDRQTGGRRRYRPVNTEEE